MWICKHCEMQNEDMETECFLCGKPQKEPVSTESEPKKAPIQPLKPVAQDVNSDKLAQAFAQNLSAEKTETPNDNVRKFVFHVPETPELQQPEPEQEPLDFEPLPENTQIYSDYMEQQDVQPSFTQQFDPLAHSYHLKKDEIVQPVESRTVHIPPVQIPGTEEKFDPTANTYRWKPENPPKTEPAQKEPEKDPMDDLRRIFAQISNQTQQNDNNVTEEIRRKNEERQRREREGDAQLPVDTQAAKAVQGREARAADRKLKLTKADKMLRSVAGLLLLAVVFLLMLLFVIKNLQGETYTISYAFEEILYKFAEHLEYGLGINAIEYAEYIISAF